MATVKELIKQLQTEEPDQQVIFQYYVAEHFSATPEQFNQAVDDLDCEELWDDAHATLREYLTGVIQDDK